MLPINPPIIDYSYEGLKIVRDDWLPGGTKRRAIARVLATAGVHINRGLLTPPELRQEFVYATPAYGLAQYAIALGCKAAGVRCTLFTAARPKGLHFRTLQAAAEGAKIMEVPYGYLSNTQAKARQYCIDTGATLLPFGLDCPEMLTGLMLAANRVGAMLRHPPTEVWVAAGSGTLTRALQAAFPEAEHHAVLVGKDAKTGRAKRWLAPEKFQAPAKYPPPFPSTDNYDAKVWRFLREHAKPGALFWNVAA